MVSKKKEAEKIKQAEIEKVMTKDTTQEPVKRQRQKGYPFIF
jgi:hypothetical protein